MPRMSPALTPASKLLAVSPVTPAAADGLEHPIAASRRPPWARDRTARAAIVRPGDPLSRNARTLVAKVRALPPPPGGQVLVGGQTVVDATVVRILLVPATMRLLGRVTWYAPGPLRRFYARYGIREADGDEEPDRPQPALTGST